MSNEGRLLLQHVSKSFARTDTNEVTTALEDINLVLNPGEFVTIVGPSGCGKSTILRLVAGLIPPTTGTVMLGSVQVKDPDPNRGMVFQKPTLFPWLTVAENVGFSLRMRGGLKGRDADIDRLIMVAGLSDFRDSWPHQLSGGMAQRVALIRTMINDPEVFLLDEPLGALDAFTRMNMQDELLRMWEERRRLVLMVTHDIDEALYMGSRVLVMAPRPGRIRENIELDMPYPRNRTSRKFLEYRTKVMEMLDFGRSEE